MRRSLGIVTSDSDPRGASLIDRWVKTDPSRIPVLYAMEIGVKPAGMCVRFWREADRLWAEMEIRDDLPWPEDTHGEVIAGVGPQGAQMMAVIATTLPEGRAGELLQQGDRQARAKRSN